MITLTGGELRQWNDQHIYSCCNYHHHSCYRDPDNNQKCIFNNSIYMSSPCQWWPCILCRIGWPRCPSGSPLDPSLGTRSGASTARLGCSSTGKPMGMLVKGHHNNYVGHGYPAYSHHDKIPQWWENVSNDEGGNVSVSKTHHTPYTMMNYILEYMWKPYNIWQLPNEFPNWISHRIRFSHTSYFFTYIVTCGQEDNGSSLNSCTVTSSALGPVPEWLGNEVLEQVGVGDKILY